MKNILLASAATLLLAVSPVMAADVIEEAPIVDLPVGFSWTGAYVGVQAGYAWGNTDITLSNPAYGDYNTDGFIGGVYVGYNFQLSNNLVLGIDGDIAWSGIDGDGPVLAPGDIPIPNQFFESDVKWTGAVRARVGYVVDRWLPYVAGGVAFAKLEHRATTNNGATYQVGGSDTYTGWTLGAGTEYAFTDNLILRAEYRYSDFGSNSFSGSGIWPDNKVEFKTHDVRIGLSYKF